MCSSFTCTAVEYKQGERESSIRVFWMRPDKKRRAAQQSTAFHIEQNSQL